MEEDASSSAGLLEFPTAASLEVPGVILPFEESLKTFLKSWLCYGPHYTKLHYTTLNFTTLHHTYTDTHKQGQVRLWWKTDF